MNPTVYRAACGSHLGMRLHQETGEDACGECLIGEAGRRLYRELIPTRPTPPPVRDAQANLAAWFDAIDEPILRVVA